MGVGRQSENRRLQVSVKRSRGISVKGESRLRSGGEGRRPGGGRPLNCRPWGGGCVSDGGGGRTAEAEGSSVNGQTLETERRPCDWSVVRI